jgi:integrase
MIDLNKNIFRLPNSITKAASRRVPISEDLKADLMRFDLSEPDNFLFGIYSPYCRRNDKKFVVSPHPLSVNVAGNLWRENVHDILHIYKKMYWFKHKGANDKEDSGMEIKTVQSVFGHSSEKITEIYDTKHEERQFEIARALMPKFV